MLCTKCSGNAHIMNIGRCKDCGSMTSSGSYSLCVPCSKKKNECQACRKDLATDGKDSGKK